jgi:hypothetical protein
MTRSEEYRQAVRATRCTVPGVSSRVTKNGAAEEGLPERDIARAQKGR